MRPFLMADHHDRKWSIFVVTHFMTVFGVLGAREDEYRTYIAKQST